MTKSTAWSCIYVPHELLAAFGPTKRLVASGTVASESHGEVVLDHEACAWCKSLSKAIEGLPSDTLVVACTSCDQARRSVGHLADSGGRQQVMLNSPATFGTNSQSLYRAEMLRLVRQLEVFFGSPLDMEKLAREMRHSSRQRAKLRSLRGTMSASELLLSCLTAQTGEEYPSKIASRLPGHTGPVVMVAGGPLTPADSEFLDCIEACGARVGAIASCTVDRYLDLEFSESVDPLTALADAYFTRPPCAWRRPNDGLYDYLVKRAAETQAKGIIWKAPRMCDIWHFEIEKARARLNLPILHLDTTYGDTASPRTATRIEAFIESLREVQ